MNLKETQKKILNLINENSSPEDAEKIRDISKELDQAIQTETELATKHEELRMKYVELVKNGGFGEDKEPEVEKTPKTFEEIAKEIINKRSK